MEEKWFLLFRGGWLGAWISRKWVNKQKGEVKDMIFICQIAIAKTSFMSKHHLPQTNIPTLPTNFPLIKTKLKRELNPYSIFLLAPQLPFPLWSNSSFPTFACASSFCSKVHNQPSRLGCSLALLYSNLEAMRHDGVLRSTSLE